jgi:hypothetical protein
MTVSLILNKGQGHSRSSVLEILKTDPGTSGCIRGPRWDVLCFTHIIQYRNSEDRIPWAAVMNGWAGLEKDAQV